MDYCNNYDNETPAIQLTIDRLKQGFLTCEEAYNSLLEETSLDLSVLVNESYTILQPELRLTDISPIAEFTNLEELNINFNAVENVEPISYLTNLKALKIQGNGVSDICLSLI